MTETQKRIMVVEDEPIAALELESTLERLGYAVVAQTDTGEDAIRLAASIRPDLVLMDISLAGEMDGIEAAGRMWHELRIPVVYLTAYSAPEVVARAAGTEPFGYLSKPFQSGNLRTTIEVALLKNRMEQALLQAHADLEQRVQERTSELLAANESLQGEIGERARIEAELSRAKEAAEVASRVKTEFLATVSHELRTPLNAIIGYNEMLMEEATEQGCGVCLEYLERVRDSAKHLLSLVKDMLDFARLDAAQLQLEMEPVAVAELVTSLVPQARELMAVNGNEFVCTTAPDVGIVRADPQRLRQCLAKLLSNAAKFTQGGCVELRAARVREEQGEFVDLSVIDTGIGIATEDADAVFEAFGQLDGSSTRRFGGLGLGLALTARLCRMMGGQIKVASEHGKGSTFSIRLPG